MAPRRFPKTDARYWLKKVFTRSNDSYHCQIAFGGKQERWPLKTSNRETAATKARDIYLSLVADGYDATRAKFKPWEVEAELNRVEKVTVGHYIDAARVVFPGKATTFLSYERKFRFLVAQLASMKADKSKFDPLEGHKRFRKTIEATLLETITPQRVEQWRLNYIKAAGRSPAKQQSARVTAASIIQNCKALFSKKILKELRHTAMVLPSPLPFDGVERGKLPRARYRSKVNIEQLAQDAYAELREQKPELFKVFLLALGAGLRRGEIDTLTWKQFNFRDGTLSIEVTEHGSLKTDSSAETIDLSADVANYFQTQMQASNSAFVISSTADPQARSPHWNRYRGNAHFKALIDWLRSKGVSDRNPLHVLRKEFGSLINQQFGIFAASAALRHSNLTITREHYVDRRERIALDVSKLLTPPATPAPVNGKPANGSPPTDQKEVPIQAAQLGVAA